MFLRFVCFCLFFSVSIVAFAQDKPNETKPPEKVNNRPAEKAGPTPEPYDNATVEEMSRCVVLHTAKGDIEIEMFPFIAPNTVRNFLNLSAIGAFENTTFGRVVPDFVIQGGNLYSNKNITYEMSVRAHKKLADEPNQIKHERGIISMAKGEEPNSAATSFFILVRSAPSLDNNFAAFGKVVKGMDVVDLINQMPVDDETPKEPVLISKASIKACEIMTEKPAVIEPPKAPKVNDLPRFGFRGRVKNVRESTIESKDKKKDSDQHGIGESLTEFGEAGDFIRMVITQDGQTVTNTNEYPPAGSASEYTFKDVIRNAEGKVVSEATFTRTSATTLDFMFYDERGRVYKKGTVVTDIDGRNLKLESEQLDADGKIESRLVTTMTYDAYGFMTSRVQVDGSGKRVFYSRYEYPELDDRANWIERHVFDSEDSDKPVQIVKRVFEYYEEN